LLGLTWEPSYLAAVADERGRGARAAAVPRRRGNWQRKGALMSKTAAIVLAVVIAIPLAICGGCLGYGFLLAPAEVEEIDQVEAPVEVP